MPPCMVSQRCILISYWSYKNLAYLHFHLSVKGVGRISCKKLFGLSHLSPTSNSPANGKSNLYTCPPDVNTEFPIYISLASADMMISVLVLF